MNAYVIYASILYMGLSVGLPAGSPRQTHPDFSGTWSVTAIRPAPPEGAPNALPPSDLTIRQSAGEISISRAAFDIVITATHDLSGRESRNRSGAVTSNTTARWDAKRLVIEGKASQITSQGYAAWKLKDVYSLNAKGHLVIDKQTVADDGKVWTSQIELVKKK